MWIHKPFFQYATAALLVVIIIFFLGKIDYFLWPFQKTVATIFFPIVIAGLLYYLVRPIVRLLSRWIPKTGSIFIVFALFIGIISGVSYFSGNAIAEQVQNLTKVFPEKMKEVSLESEKAIKESKIGVVEADNFSQKAEHYLNSLAEKMVGNLSDIISIITSVATVLVIVPFILFYFLKDDQRLKPFLLKYLPDEHEGEGNVILHDVDKTLSTYIIGQFIIALVDGVLMYIGYLIIGIDYAIILALFAMVLTVVPFLGPMMGVIPALFIALQQEPFMAVKVLIVLAIVQQLEGYLVTPHVMGKRLNIHPLTIILLLLVAGSIYGFLGILLAIPLYSVIKTLIKNFRLFYQLRKRREESPPVSLNKNK
ncbi:AI-2E family transporter [Peribacillus saganii]|uniref:AI-2E family transporter n=1 Tax=Peribacillus saganii TaxID=2303992 RepID=A0A372LLG5_9BACI|nr:AI-2E family transporter [Peribacillus saganii]RFU67662.1 AI-2E family transporter [Peribacillus saganii]